MKKTYIFVLLLFAIGQTITAQNVQSIVQQFMTSNIGESNIKASDVAEWDITDIVPSLNPAIQHVYVQQKYQGIPVENGRYKLTVNDGKVTWFINQFVSNMDQKVNALSASITPNAAISKVASNHQLSSPTNLTPVAKSAHSFEFDNTGISREPIIVDQVFFYTKEGSLKLGWKVNLYQLDGNHWWNEIIDASSGQVLATSDWVTKCDFGTPDHENHEHTAFEERDETAPTTYEMTSLDAALVGGGSYNVYPLGIESPDHGNRAVVSDPANAVASPFGWHDTNGANGPEFTITRGNNVWAQDDINGNNGTGSSPDGGSNLDFDFPLNLNNTPSTYIDAAVVNLFYWNNIMHDVWYQYGFDEASGNFQENNYGKGGAGSDSVNADAQDGSSSNNANFATPTDGSNPRMQMFLWTNPTRDGDFDNVIIAHEYGHGISFRLVGGPNANVLGGSEQMGEGWSDWFGLVMTIRPGDNRNTPRSVGTFAIGQSTTGGGIRPTRYSTDLAVNGTTYNDIGGLAVPHGVGYGFATILWDMTWDLIDLEGYDADQYNGTGGNNIAMALVIEGLKNTANNPGFVSGRDGILQADQDLYGGQYNCLIWDAFARRGVGIDAVENNNGGNNSNTDQTTSFTSGCSTPPPPASCNSTVANFPYSQGFENTLGAWSQDAGNDFDWALRTGGTPSDNTGPSGAFEGTHYIYVEASDPNFGGKTTILNSPCFDFPNGGGLEASFHYQMTGNSVGTIRLEAREDGSTTWTELWSQSGDQGAAWIEQNVDLGAYAGDTVQLRFRGTTNSSWQGDIAIDAFGISTSTSDDTDTQAPTNPTNLTVTGVTTSSAGLSWNASSDNVAVVGYEVFQGNTNLGLVAGTSTNIVGLEEGTTYQFRVRAADAAGNVSGDSNTVSATTDTSTPPSGGCVGGETAPYSESYEATLGLWTQGSGDDLNWIRDSAGTASNGTGPSSGSDGSFYVYVEASVNGTGYPNKRAIFNSPCFDLSGETEASFVFDYHMFGSSDGGRIDLEVSTDGGTSWSSIWNQTGNQGNQWNTVSINLGAYLGGAIQLRFNRVTGGTWQSDVAIDNARLQAGGDPGTPSGYCASNGNVITDEFIQRVQIGGIDNSTGASAGGYSDYTNLSTTLGSSNSITITPEWTGSIYAEAYSVWVDFNRDGDFGDAGEQVFTRSPTTATSITGNFSVPAGASQGATRMRVSMKYNGVPGACESFTYGEVEDYTVVIGSTAQGFGGDDASLSNYSQIAGTFDFTIFPNPVTGGQLSINLKGEDAESYTVYNMVGQTVMKGTFSNTLDVSRLNAGVYIIEIAIGNETHNKRFVKK